MARGVLDQSICQEKLASVTTRSYPQIRFALSDRAAPEILQPPGADKNALFGTRRSSFLPLPPDPEETAHLMPCGGLASEITELMT